MQGIGVCCIPELRTPYSKLVLLERDRCDLERSCELMSPHWVALCVLCCEPLKVESGVANK